MVNLFLFLLPLVANVDSADVDLISRVVFSECSICSEEEQSLVVSVILNRVDSERFPNTVEGVVYQNRQFAPPSNNQAYKKHIPVVLDVTRGNRDCKVLFFTLPSTKNKKFLKYVRENLVMSCEYHIFAK